MSTLGGTTTMSTLRVFSTRGAIMSIPEGNTMVNVEKVIDKNTEFVWKTLCMNILRCTHGITQCTQ